MSNIYDSTAYEFTRSNEKIFNGQIGHFTSWIGPLCDSEFQGSGFVRTVEQCWDSAIMQMWTSVVLLTAFLYMRLAAANITLTLPARKARGSSSHGHISQWETQHIETLKNSGVLTYREIQNLLRRESGGEGAPVDCCPTVEELSEPVGGKNREERYVELYRDGENKQVFYEYSCRSDVLDQPCRFVDRKLANQSRCVQRFSYTYALVSDPRARSNHQRGAGEEYKRRHGKTQDSVLPDISTITTPGTNWSLDYIRVRSGCSCELLPKQRKKKSSISLRTKKSRNKWRKRTDPKVDEENRNSPESTISQS